MSRTLLFFVIAFCGQSGIAQQLVPADGAVITRTSILFEVPEVVGAKTYTYHIESAKGNTIDLTDDNHVLRVDGLSFGESYNWKVTALDSVGKTLYTYNQGFEIATSDFVNPKETRFHIVGASNNRKIKGLIFLDYSRVAITPDGKPVWFLPERESLKNKRLRDLKLTNRGTVTYLDALKCEESSLDGDLIWSTPDTSELTGESNDLYHHEFTLLSNGNYLALGKEFVPSELMINGAEVSKLPLSVIIEYSPEGKVVWSWSSSEFISNEDILAIGQKVGVGNTFGHMNAAYFDVKTGVIYASFRDLDCILTIEKESGKILQSYGDKIPSDTTTQGIDLFAKQHAPIKLRGDRLLFFNNNERNETSSVQIISEVTDENPKAEILWEFFCDFDSLRPAHSPRMGNALPLEDEHILVNMGKAARVFEVSPDKEVTWQCFPEIWDGGLNRWHPQPNYRTFNISSLYPYYHTVSLRNEKIRVYNEGSEDDTYIIRAYAEPKKRKKTKKVELTIEKGQFIDIQLSSLFNRKLKSKTVYVEVSSKNNPGLVVERSYLVR
ncbi:MAG: aryl-sulfate sulfotransferase [Flavobacteriales bacterium]|nr:aryl-sulfate sulfotransferase [Flavobacteriales bacterium]